MRVAVVGVQGDVEEHLAITKKALDDLGIDGKVVAVRKPGLVSGCDAVIIPGGESTTISKLIWKDSIASEIIELADSGHPIMGTCAGLIIISKHGDEQVRKTETKLLGLLDVRVRRNAFGRQRESFEAPLKFDEVGEYNAVFIRAPVIDEVGSNVRVLARFEDKVVAAREKNILGLSFHPELTNDTRIHRYFLTMV